MSQPSKQSISAARQLFEDQHYVKYITCPAHPRMDHVAKLYTFGHEFAGIWECPFGESDSHDCQEFETATATSTYWSPELEDTIDVERPVQVCVTCGVAQEEL